jgi:hypothetical protein
MVGWVEIALGVGFTDLADRFEQGGTLVKAGITESAAFLIR